MNHLRSFRAALLAALVACAVTTARARVIAAGADSALARLNASPRR